MENCVKEFGHSLGKEGIKPKETGKKSGNLFFLKSYPLFVASQVTFVTQNMELPAGMASSPIPDV